MILATAPAIATQVASTTLPVIRISVRNTMVERKSVPSLMKTSVMVALSLDVSVLRCPDPVAVEAVGNPMSQLHQRDGAGLDIGRIEHRQVAAVFAPTVNDGQEPAAALAGSVSTRDKYGFGD